MAVPLAHFVVRLGFLVVGGLAGLATVLGLIGGLAHVHLLLVGWVCVTIAGAMTQFVPVWAGVRLHSGRLAVAQLWLLATGMTGFAAVLLSGAYAWLAVPGAVLALGFAALVYNVGRTLARTRPRGTIVFAGKMLGVVREHGPRVPALLLGREVAAPASDSE